MIGMGLNQLNAYEQFARDTGLTHAPLEAAFVIEATRIEARDPRPYSPEKFLRGIYNEIQGARTHRGAEALPDFPAWIKASGFDAGTYAKLEVELAIITTA